MLNSPTFKEPDIALFVFIGGAYFLWNAPPVSRGQGRVSRLQTAVPDAPGIAGLEEEQFPTDYRHSIEVCVTSVRLQTVTARGDRKTGVNLKYVIYIIQVFF